VGGILHHPLPELLQSVIKGCTKIGNRGTTKRNPKVDFFFNYFNNTPPVLFQTLLNTVPFRRGKGGEENRFGGIKGETSTVLKEFESFFNARDFGSYVWVTSPRVITVELHINRREAL
jgi:hypothetical protein